MLDVPAVVTGLHGQGVMLSPVTGRVVRSLVSGEEPLFPMTQFQPDQFDDHRPILTIEATEVQGKTNEALVHDDHRSQTNRSGNTL